MKDKIHNIKYTTLNGIFVPELSDIVAFIEQQGHTSEYVINAKATTNKLVLNQIKDGIEQEVEFLVDFSNYVDLTSAQEISGGKNFTGYLTQNNDPVVTATMLNDYYTKTQSDDKFAWASTLGFYVKKDGTSVMSGALQMGYNKIAQVQDPNQDYDAVNLRTLNTKLTDGSVTKVGTDTVGGTLKPMYLNAGVPTNGTQLYNKTIGINGTSWNIIRPNNTDVGNIYAPTAAGTSGQYLKSSGGTPSWASFTCGSWSNVAFTGSSGVVLAPNSGFTFSTASGHMNKYRVDTLGRIEVSLRTTITTSSTIPANSYVGIGLLNKTNGGVDVWVMGTILVNSKYYSVPVHISNSGGVFLSNTTSSAIQLNGAQLQVTFFTN